MKGVYLDNSMAARPSQEAVSAMMPYLHERFGNALSPHQMGQQLSVPIEESYRSLYTLLGAPHEDGLLFTSSGEEAVNWVIASTYHEVSIAKGKNQFIAAKTDEAAALMAISHLEQLGCVIKLADPDSQGIVNAERIGDLLTPRTALVSISWANGLTGLVQPVQEIGLLCKERGVLFHLDATHILGKLHFDLREIGADFISFNGNQIHAPHSAGGLYVKRGVPLRPLIFGGMQQAGKRGSPLDVASLVALGVAAHQALESRDHLGTEIARLRNLLEDGLVKALPDAVILYKEKERLPHCTAIAFPAVHQEALLFALDRQGIYASIGGGSFQQLGILLKAMGVPELLAHTAVSFSLSRETTEAEVLRTIEVVASSVEQLRRISHEMMV